ncbi:transcriptional regulator [Agromyces aureus]|uniref:ArsR family transcriptional regulator n=1 Tax=Agromyces aureus TaxID=453304 RepID=A0A191WHM1_9MICO|nr:transcriptional regulator [Agromyces aureus]ANJ27756.1 ArsR family transcriptional regulator [Agromyces aureus]
MAHARHQLDDAFLTPVRFSLVAALGRDTEMDFAALRDLLEVSDSVLSKAISHLDGLGYVRVTKGYAGNRPRTWVATTRAGASAFDRHVRALRVIAGGVGRDDETP